MFNFLLTATGTWALWRVLDAWLYPGGRDNPGQPMALAAAAVDSREVGRVFAGLDDPDSRVAVALRAIAVAAGTAPGVLARRVEDVFAQLSREECAAVSLLLLLWSRTQAE